MKRYKQETSILICAYTPDDVMYRHTQTTNDLEISILSTVIYKMYKRIKDIKMKF